jgi:putative Mg2+ transporter-C (MgtC) family protein
MFFDLDRNDILIRIGLSLLLGGILGMERQRKDKPAGLRTYGLVCEGAALFMMGSILIGQEVHETWGTPYDPSRIGSTIVQGIGFLAAGVIFTSRGRIQGLTTAAGVWVTAAIGLLVGAGFFLIASVAVGATILYLIGTDFLERRFFRGPRPQGPAGDVELGNE